MNINYKPCSITREKLIEMLYKLINDVWSKGYYDITELNYLKEDSFVEKILTCINEFTIKILDIHQACKQVPEAVFSRIIVDHRREVEQGEVLNNKLNVDFIVTNYRYLEKHCYMYKLIRELTSVGLRDLEYDKVSYKIIDDSVTCEDYINPYSQKKVVTYHHDYKTIIILDEKYNVIKDVLDIKYSTPPRIKEHWHEEFKNMHIILK